MNSYTPAPMNFGSVPQPQSMGAPLWQPGQQLMPMGGAPSMAMPQMAPQMMQPQMMQPQMMQSMPAQPSYIPMAAPTTVAAPQIIQSQPQVTQMQPQIMQAQPQFQSMQPQVMQPQVMQPQVMAAPMIEQVQYSAPPQATVVEYSQPQYQSQPRQMASNAITTVAQPYMEQQRMASVPMGAPAYTSMAQPQAVSYLPPQQQAVSVMPQVSSYIPAAEPMYMPQVSSYIPQPAPQVTYAPQANVVETRAPQFAPTMAATTMAAPVSYAQPQNGSYLPAPVMMEQYAQPQYAQPQSYLPAPVMMEQYAQPQVVEQLGGQSVIVEQVGDWLVCEDASGIFYHHSPTEQSFDDAPAEFLMLFPQGYAPPPVGAFAEAPQVIETFAQPQYAQAQTYGAPQQYGQPMQAQVLSQGIMQGQPQSYAPQVMMQGQGPQVMQQGQFQGSLPPIMAKVLN